MWHGGCTCQYGEDTGADDASSCGAGNNAASLSVRDFNTVISIDLFSFQRTSACAHGERAEAGRPLSARACARCRRCCYPCRPHCQPARRRARARASLELLGYPVCMRPRPLRLRISHPHVHLRPILPRPFWHPPNHARRHALRGSARTLARCWRLRHRYVFPLASLCSCTRQHAHHCRFAP